MNGIFAWDNAVGAARFPGREGIMQRIGENTESAFQEVMRPCASCNQLNPVSAIHCGRCGTRLRFRQSSLQVTRKPISAWLLLVPVALAIVLFVGVSLANTLSGISRPNAQSGEQRVTGIEYATIWARDEQGDLLPGGSVNLWSDYTARERVTGQARDGARVRVLRRLGDGVYIKTMANEEGWVSSWFLHAS